MRALRLISRLVRFFGDRRGVSAVEFAIILPFMVAAYLGTVEVSQGIAVNRKVTLTSHAVADLASQYTTIHDSDMTNILAAASAVIAPFGAGSLKVTVSELTLDANGNATVAWSSTLNGTALSVGQAVTIPAALQSPNTYLIFGQAQYAYNPAFGVVLTSTLTMSDQIYMTPRTGSSITRTSP
jgi:Flp pilus assembly protein TadG